MKRSFEASTLEADRRAAKRHCAELSAQTRLGREMQKQPRLRSIVLCIIHQILEVQGGCFQNILRSMDADGNGTISCEEVLHILPVPAIPSPILRVPPNFGLLPYCCLYCCPMPHCHTPGMAYMFHTQLFRSHTHTIPLCHDAWMSLPTPRDVQDTHVCHTCSCPCPSQQMYQYLLKPQPLGLGLNVPCERLGVPMPTFQEIQCLGGLVDDNYDQVLSYTEFANLLYISFNYFQLVFSECVLSSVRNWPPSLTGVTRHRGALLPDHEGYKMMRDIIFLMLGRRWMHRVAVGWEGLWRTEQPQYHHACLTL